jgi:hypothetical protein
LQPDLRGQRLDLQAKRGERSPQIVRNVRRGLPLGLQEVAETGRQVVERSADFGDLWRTGGTDPCPEVAGAERLSGGPQVLHGVDDRPPQPVGAGEGDRDQQDSQCGEDEPRAGHALGEIGVGYAHADHGSSLAQDDRDQHRRAFGCARGEGAPLAGDFDIRVVDSAGPDDGAIGKVDAGRRR